MDWLISYFAPQTLGTGGLTVDNLPTYVKKSFAPLSGSKTLFVCLPGWGQKLWKWQRVRALARHSNASFLAYQFPRAIFSDDKESTKDIFKAINTLVRTDIKELKQKYTFGTCILIGVSLASSYGSMIYKNNSDINEIVLIVPGENLARDMWVSRRTQHLKKSLEQQGVTEMELENYWAELVSGNNIPAPTTRVKLFFAKKDKVIPFTLSRKLYEVLKNNNVEVTQKSFPVGHYFLAAWFLLFPKKFLSR